MIDVESWLTTGGLALLAAIVFAESGLLVGFFFAALGDQVGYLFGRRVGPSLFSRPERRLFNPSNAQRAQVFFEKRGPRSIVLARFVPIVRIFVPIVAGVGAMRCRTFVTYNLIGAALWSIGITILGYYPGEIDVVKHNLEIAAIVVVTISLIPVGLEFARSR